MEDRCTEDDESAVVLHQLSVDSSIEPHTHGVGTAAGGIKLHGASIEQNRIAIDQGDGKIDLGDCLILGENDVGISGSLVGVALNVLHDYGNEAHAVVAIPVDIGQGYRHLVAGNRDGTESGAKAGDSLGEFELGREYAGGILTTLPNGDSLTEAVGVELGAVGEATAHAEAAESFEGDELR